MKRLSRLVNACSILIIIALVGGIENSIAGPVRCSDIFNQVESRIENQSQFNQDFGPGVFIQKTSTTEFHIQPPPTVLSSARAAQRKLRELAANDSGEQFTVLFYGMSEGEVLAFRAMLQRDSRLQADERLSAILLATEDAQVGESKSYDQVSKSAKVAREQMLRRYDWAKAKVSRENTNRATALDVYRLTVDKSTEVETFLLTLRLKAAQFVKNRTIDISLLLASQKLANATTEQMAHMIVSELKKKDPGITAGTLRVMAADFIIAQAEPGLNQ